MAALHDNDLLFVDKGSESLDVDSNSFYAKPSPIFFLHSLVFESNACFLK